MSWRRALFVCALRIANAQTDASPDPQPDPENWNIYYQATSVGMHHGSFPALYSGPLSLRNTPENEVSLTTTLFVGFRWLDTEFYINPEIAGGRGFSNVN